MKRKTPPVALPEYEDGEPRVGTSLNGALLSSRYPTRIAFMATTAHPRVNEEGALEACCTVVQALNEAGGRFEKPIRPTGMESGIDAISQSEDGSLKFQVTRAMRDSEYWKFLSVNKEVMAYRDMNEIAYDLWDAIEFKASGMAAADRREISLVLDACSLAAHGSAEAAEFFVEAFGKQASELGFYSIWVTDSLSSRAYRLI